MPRSRQRGYTLVEGMLSLAVIVTIGAITLGGTRGYFAHNRHNQLDQQVELLFAAIRKNFPGNSIPGAVTADAIDQDLPTAMLGRDGANALIITHAGGGTVTLPANAYNTIALTFTGLGAGDCSALLDRLARRYPFVHGTSAATNVYRNDYANPAVVPNPANLATHCPATSSNLAVTVHAPIK